MSDLYEVLTFAIGERVEVEVTVGADEDGRDNLEWLEGVVTRREERADPEYPGDPAVDYWVLIENQYDLNAHTFKTEVHDERVRKCSQHTTAHM